jgi:PiT family inorganic phosphate transporter
MPATFALNPEVPNLLAQLGPNAGKAIPLIEQYGNDQKEQAITAARALRQARPAPADLPQATRAQLRGDVYDVLAQLKHVGEVPTATPADKAAAAGLRHDMGQPVQYAPIWVRMLSALCLGLGTMVGYKRVVRTLGERLGKSQMTPGQGLSAELVGSVLIGTAGFTGLPVSTTHIITSGIAGTMMSGGQGVQRSMITRIVMAWLFTLPVTMLIAGALFWMLGNPSF